jgi:hypothetical protein
MGRRPVRRSITGVTSSLGMKCAEPDRAKLDGAGDATFQRAQTWVDTPENGQ